MVNVLLAPPRGSSFTFSKAQVLTAAQRLWSDFEVHELPVGGSELYFLRLYEPVSMMDIRAGETLVSFDLGVSHDPMYEAALEIVQLAPPGTELMFVDSMNNHGMFVNGSTPLSVYQTLWEQGDIEM